MKKLGRLWAGKLYGTNTGNLGVELEDTDGTISGVVRFLDDRFGAVVYAVQGTFDGTIVKLEGAITQAPANLEVGTIFITGSLTAEGQLRGEWSSTLGTGGTFHLFPHDVGQKNEENAVPLPEQLHSATRSLGALRLYADDVRELVGSMRRDFNQAAVVVTYRERGNEIAKYFPDFERDFTRLGKLQYLKLTIQEPEAYGINRVVNVELNATGNNEVRVQGVQESWVIGKAESVASQLQLSQKTLSTTFRRFGLNINGLLALCAITLLPELTIPRRIIFITLVVLMSWAIVQLHVRFIPNVSIHLSERKPSFMERVWPQVLSWCIAASAGLVAAIAYGILKGELLTPSAPLH